MTRERTLTRSWLVSAVIVLAGWGSSAVAQESGKIFSQKDSPADYARLCGEYFEARNGTFEPAEATKWCRLSSAAGDAQAMLRLGLLSLAGVGTAKDLGVAETLCTAAHARDASVSSAFCVAAVLSERRSKGQSAEVPRSSGAAIPGNAATMSKWRDQANRGETAASSHLCDAYFDARNGSFDPAETAEWCRLAAEYGDARAIWRIGLMHLWGVGMEKSVQQAEALCDAAQERDASVSAAFCLAAVRQQYDDFAAEDAPSKVVYPEPWPAVRSPATPDPSVLPRALGPDRALESVHVTAGGLRYNCRYLGQWARYGIPLDAQAFGRPISGFTKQDYANLDAAAVDCANDIAPYDKDGSERSLLAEFRKLLVPLGARQRDIINSTASRNTEAAVQTKLDQSLNRRVLVMVAGLSPIQQRCVAEIGKAWLGRDYDVTASLLEIRSATTNDESAATVVSGNAAVIDTAQNMNSSARSYSCTFASGSSKIIARSLGAGVSHLSASDGGP